MAKSDRKNARLEEELNTKINFDAHMQKTKDQNEKQNNCANKPKLLAEKKERKRKQKLGEKNVQKWFTNHFDFDCDVDLAPLEEQAC